MSVSIPAASSSPARDSRPEVSRSRNSARAVFAGPGEERIFHERRYKAFSLADSSTLTNMAVLVCGDAGGERTAFLRDFTLRSGALRNLQSGAPALGAGADRSSGLSISADPVAERMLPADALGYHGIDALILGDADDLRLEPEQVRAIRDWVYLGGRVIFAPVGRSLAGALRLAAKGYKVSISESRVQVRDSARPQALIVSLGGMYNFADSFQIGVFEGAVHYYGHDADITIRRHSPFDVDLHIAWT